MRSRCVLQSQPRQAFEETWTERPINRLAHLAACRDRPGEIKRQDELVRNELLAEVDSIAPILAEHAPDVELDAPFAEHV
jgi:hypothetical protein